MPFYDNVFGVFSAKKAGLFQQIEILLFIFDIK